MRMAFRVGGLYLNVCTGTKQQVLRSHCHPCCPPPLEITALPRQTIFFSFFFSFFVLFLNLYVPRLIQSFSASCICHNSIVILFTPHTLRLLHMLFIRVTFTSVSQAISYYSDWEADSQDFFNACIYCSKNDFLSILAWHLHIILSVHYFISALLSFTPLHCNCTMRYSGKICLTFVFTFHLSPSHT